MAGSPPKVGGRKSNSLDQAAAEIHIQDEESDHDDGSQHGSQQGSRPNSGLGSLTVNDEVLSQNKSSSSRERNRSTKRFVFFSFSYT